MRYAIQNHATTPDRNGNSRRAWVVYDMGGLIASTVAVYPENGEGQNAIAEVLRGRYTLLPLVEIKPTAWRRLVRFGALKNAQAEENIAAHFDRLDAEAVR